MNLIGSLLKVRDVTISFPQAAGIKRTVLNSVSLDLPVNKILALMGANGAGKTTLLNVISGDLTCDSGRLELGGISLTNLMSYQRAKLIGRVNQDSYKSVASDLTVGEVLGIAFKRRKILGLHRPDLESSIREIGVYSPQAASSVKALSDSPTRNLSGGERQLLAVALAVLGDPHLLLLDEHLASLDEKYKRTADQLLSSYVGQNECSIISVTHDYAWANSFADYIGVIENGSLNVKTNHKTHA
jgi:putative ABC transport system ATP-binding protein